MSPIFLTIERHLYGIACCFAWCLLAYSAYGSISLDLLLQKLVEEIKAQFFKGYTEGLQNFDREIGSFFFSLAPAEQLKVLVDFMNYCHHHLYFEGFVIPEVLYSLGYIQACLVQSYKTYQNLSKLSVKEITGEPLIDKPLPDFICKDQITKYL